MSSYPVLVLNSGSSSIKFGIYETAEDQRTKLFEGAVDGIGTDLGKFWIKDADGKKLVDQTPGAAHARSGIQPVTDTAAVRRLPCPGSYRPSHGVRRAHGAAQPAHYAGAD